MGQPDQNRSGGDVIADRYRLVSPLGKGGMGVVWLAEHLALGENVAIKLLHEDRQRADAAARFLQEAQAAARLRSPHVVQLLDYGVVDGVPYLVMELLRGAPLSAILHAEGRLAPARALAVLQQVARALTKAHRSGIVHRDLKPSNIQVIDDDGELMVKVLDFGVAKMLDGPLEESTDTGAMIGTPHYMSPEQAQGKKTIDHRSDQWSFALVAAAPH